MNLIQLIPAMLTSLCSIGIFIFQKQLRHNMSYFLMGVFRDVGRIKSHRRRMQRGNGKALLLRSDLDILLRKDDPLKYLKLDDENEDLTQNLQTYTEEELLEFGSGVDGNPLLLSLFGRVYDVTKGDKYYGEDGRYHIFAGRDVTHALATGCLEEDCLGTRKFDTTILTEKQMNEGKRWLSFFQLHDKYSYVGNLDHDGIDFMIDSLVIESLKNVSEDDFPGNGEECSTMSS